LEKLISIARQRQKFQNSFYSKKKNILSIKPVRRIAS